MRVQSEYELKRASEGAAGFDLRINEDVKVLGDRPAEIVGTGVRVAIPDGNVGLVFIRSSMGKRGIKLANSVGVIDADYRGEIKLALVSHGPNYQHLERGTRVAQLVIVPCYMGGIEHVEWLDETARGDGGFGSTGES